MMLRCVSNLTGAIAKAILPWTQRVWLIVAIA